MSESISEVTNLAHLGDVYKQDTAPASPSDLAVWLDTSQDPPVWKAWSAATGEWRALSESSSWAWMPLTTVVSGEPELVWDDDDSLIPTKVPI